MGMKGLIRKEWYSLWSQYRIHMLAMLGLGVLLPIIKNTDFFPDESFWIYCAVITIFYILMHSVEYEKKSNWDMYRATFPINGREIVVSKYIFGFGIVIIASILVFAGSMVWLKVVNNNIDEYLDKDNISRELISYEGKKTNLEYYIITCNYKGVEKKLNQGEKVNQIFKKSGKTPLMIAATIPNFKDAIKMSQILIKEGADVNKKDIYGANVLFYVGYYDYEKRTSEENIKLLKYYIDKDTEINIKIDGVDNDGNLKKNGKRISLIQFYKDKKMEKEAKFLSESVK